MRSSRSCGGKVSVITDNGSLYPKIIQPSSTTKCTVSWVSDSTPDHTFGNSAGTCQYNSCLNGTPMTALGSGGEAGDYWGY